MSNLLVLSPPPTRVAPGFGMGHSAEILFFTGVRYYRMPDDGVSPHVISKPALPSEASRPIASTRAGKLPRAIKGSSVVKPRRRKPTSDQGLSNRTTATF